MNIDFSLFGIGFIVGWFSWIGWMGFKAWRENKK